MTDVAENSSNTLVTNGGQSAPDGIPTDGTGEGLLFYLTIFYLH